MNQIDTLRYPTKSDLADFERSLAKFLIARQYVGIKWMVGVTIVYSIFLALLSCLLLRSYK